MTERGVSIYLALVIMFILLAIGLGVSLIIVSQMRMIGRMGDSVIALYAADTGIDKTIFYDNKVTPGNIERGICDICNNCPITDCIDCSVSGTDCDFLSGDTCTDCTVTYNTTFNGKTYYVKATVSGGLTTISSTGSYEGTKRAIEVVRVPPPKKVFVTSNTYDANLEDEYAIDPDPNSGLDDADLICQDRANTAGLTGTYKAWLSDGTTSADSRLFHSAGPYERIDGTVIANSWTDLTDGAIQNRININELRNDVGNVDVFTNTRSNGSIGGISGNQHCNNWTVTAGLIAQGGDTGSTSSEWTASWGALCGKTARLYCFEQ